MLLAVQTGNSVGGSRSHNMPHFVVDEMSVLFPDKEGKHYEVRQKTRVDMQTDFEKKLKEILCSYYY